MQTLIQDIKHGMRTLLKSPGFTVVAVISLALGIGGNTAIFSLLNTVLLKPLPVRNPHELRTITWMGGISPRVSYCRTFSLPDGQTKSNVFTYPAYCEFRDHSSPLAEVFAFVEFRQSVLVARAQASTGAGLLVSGNFFQGLGLLPFIGQTITPDRDRSDSEPVTVISYAAWQQLFGSDPDIAGQTLTINAKAFTVIGVLPKDFLGIRSGYRSDFYIPIVSEPQMRSSLQSTDLWWVQVMARLAPNVTDQQIRAPMEALLAQRSEVEALNRAKKPLRIVLEDASGGPLESRHAMAKSLPMLMGLMGFVLLAACVNLAGLLLARGAVRQHELAVRAALGAGRGRMVRQLLAESVLMALAGAGLGYLLASWGKAVVGRLLWLGTVVLDLRSDARVFAFTLFVALATALLFGLIPALLSTRVNPMTSLKDRSSLGTPRLRLGRVLISIQVAISMVLLVGAGLFAHTLVNLYRVETGFDTKNLLVFTLDTSAAGLKDEQIPDFHEQVRESIAAMPGVQAVAYSNQLLLSGWMNNSMAHVKGSTNVPEAGIPILGLATSDSYLSTMAIPLLLGRGFDASDSRTSQKVIIVNRTLARTAFDGDNPIGRFLTINSIDYEIVGMCGDITYATLKKPAEPTVFYLFRQHPRWLPQHYEVRTLADPMTLVPAIRETVARLNARVPVDKIKTQAIQRDESIAQERMFAALCGALALLAVLLTCIGLYGLMAYSISRRASEIGLRMAIGARPWDIAKSVLHEALLLAAMGAAVGVPAALVLTRFIRALLYGVHPYDPVTLAIALVLLLAVALLATWLPARRAAKVDPMVALRCE
jgi:predicted permease